MPPCRMVFCPSAPWNDLTQPQLLAILVNSTSVDFSTLLLAPEEHAFTHTLMSPAWFFVHVFLQHIHDTVLTRPVYPATCRCDLHSILIAYSDADWRMWGDIIYDFICYGGHTKLHRHNELYRSDGRLKGSPWHVGHLLSLLPCAVPTTAICPIVRKCRFLYLIDTYDEVSPQSFIGAYVRARDLPTWHKVPKRA